MRGVHWRYFTCNYLKHPSHLIVLFRYVLNYMDQIDLEKFRVKSEPNNTPVPDAKRPRHKPGVKFFAGPVPWDWLSTAANLPGRAMHVAIALWFLKSVKYSDTVALSGKLLRELGVERQAGYRGLKALENAGLVSCTRAPGRLPVVTIILTSVKSNGNGNEGDMKGDNP
jgi:hypothetical protein